MDTAIWKCSCGAVEAKVPTVGKRIVCYCKSCRSFVEQFGKTDRLDGAGGNDLLQVDSKHVSFLKGQEHLRWTKLTEKGPMRWYTACCDTPMANTLSTRAAAFASFQVADITPKEHLPEISTRVNRKAALARVEGDPGSAWPMIAALLRNSVASWVTGAWRRHPFFDQKGAPIGPRQEPETPSG